jgi:octaprenyl-diphosphate synthase
MSPSLSSVRQLISSDLDALDDCIRQSLRSEVELVNEMGSYIVEAGGKRIRPMLTLLSARALGATGNSCIKLAAVVELIHTATLLHDDVVDASALRRGRRTANAVWGNQAPVLVGDFIYSRSFQLMVEVARLEVLDVMAQATNAIAEGEVLQLLQCHQPDTDEAMYFQVIERKTARLFEAAARLGGLVADCAPGEAKALAGFGFNLGIAYQLVDDVIDYSTEADESGKNPGDDLAEGKMTLPLLQAMRMAGPELRASLAEVVRSGDAAGLATVRLAIESTGAIAYTAARADEYAARAGHFLEVLPPSAHVDALRQLLRLAVERSA